MDDEVIGGRILYEKGFCICGSKLYFEHGRYFCSAKRHKTKKKCDQPYAKYEKVEKEFNNLILQLQKLIKKSSALKDLTYEINKIKKAYLSDLKENDKEIKLAAIDVLRTPEIGPDLKNKMNLRALETYVDEMYEKEDTLSSMYSQIRQCIKFFEKSQEYYRDEPLYVLMYFKAIYLKDGKIDSIELKAGPDYVVKKAIAENPGILKFKVRHNEALINLDVQETAKYILQNKEESIYYVKKPSLKEQRKAWRDSGEKIYKSIDEVLLFKILFKIPFLGVRIKEAIEETETEVYQSIDFARSVQNRPSIYKIPKNGSLTLEIGKEESAKVLKYQLKELEWLVKNKPVHYKQYYDWEHETHHQIGKIFGWKSKEYKGFGKLCIWPIIWLIYKEKKIDKFMAKANKTKSYIENCIT